MSYGAHGEHLEQLRKRYAHLDGPDLLAPMIREVFSGRIAAVTSFGLESAVLLDVVAEVAPDLPVIFLETGKHFSETLIYRDRLCDQLGLQDVRSVAPDPDEVAREDPDGDLNQSDPDRCCELRKVRPLARSLQDFDAWITGRKRFQSASRAGLSTVEFDGHHYKINPLARWRPRDLERRFVDRKLARHTLGAVGYTSIGCAPCTHLPPDPDDHRSGRWAASEKTECGIHNATWARSGPRGSPSSSK
jgi:phosphoadenosine phosphosulfate reductase